MTDHATPRLSLPLVQAAQAQKHVTVNESLARLDGMVNLVLQSAQLDAPPGQPVEGACYGVPPGASGAWAGQDGRIAMAANGGGWSYVEPRRGMQAFVADRGVSAVFDGELWVEGALTLGQFGSALMARTEEIELDLTSGGSVTSTLYLPPGGMVIGVAARVTQAITGSLFSWRLGTEGALDRFGANLGTQAGSWARGMLSQPLTYWEPAPVILTATGGDFAGGRVRIAAHWLELGLPG
ncbi:DUF2793 domain-containing protein [Paracoccus jeotgali]|uniref:DUF2793 domain-containing protein n=1 Tax=Paracoccus jeotgali TaxID=2065379 RepID=A0A2K9MDC9_9RHOB|nr:DUF2793 domain-containing protein [Paracoccus jeotgali]AUM73502.1 hypothetical protein CYR75_03640 [Paracoccus jeotgali]